MGILGPRAGDNEVPKVSPVQPARIEEFEPPKGPQPQSEGDTHRPTTTRPATTEPAATRPAATRPSVPEETDTR
jgi:hypothetical protein